MSGRTAVADRLEWDVDPETRAYLERKPGLRSSDVRRWAPFLWDQTARVHAALSGPEWQLRLTPEAPLPSWLIELTSGHIGSALDVPAPTLFRTAGIGMRWLDTPVDALELHARLHRRERGRMLIGRLMHGIDRLGGAVDADVYVIGDGFPDGKFRAEIHAVIGQFDRELNPAEYASFSTGFRVSPPIWQGGRSVSHTWTPRREAEQ